MGALSMLPAENKRVILGCKMVTLTVRRLGWAALLWSIKI